MTKRPKMWLAVHSIAIRNTFLALLSVLAVIGFFAGPVYETQKYLLVNNWVGKQIGYFLANFAPEMAGIVLGFLVIDLLNAQRQQEEFRAQLIRKMGSDSRDVSIPAVIELRNQPWLTDGSLRAKHFDKADLRGAQLAGARLEECWFIRAQLEDAVLVEAHLEEAILWHAYLNGAVLEEAHFEGADLSDADLLGARMEGAHFEGAILRSAKLISTGQYPDHRLKDTHFEGANMQYAILRNANLQDTYLDGADLRWAHMEGCNLEGVMLKGVVTSRRIVEGQFKVEETHFKGVDLRGTHMEGANLQYVGLEGANLAGIHLEEANLMTARLSRAKLWKAHLEGADLWAANLSGADLFKAHLEGADFTRANLERTRNLTRAQLLEATTLRGATMPDGRRLKDPDADPPYLDGPTLQEWIDSIVWPEDEEE